MQRESFSNPRGGCAAQRALRFPRRSIASSIRPSTRSSSSSCGRRSAAPAGPLNVVLTPDGFPLVGFTYLPVEDFTRLLEQLTSRWATDREELGSAARQVSDFLANARRPAASGTMDADGRRARPRRCVRAAGVGGRRRSSRGDSASSRSSRPSRSSRCCWTGSAASRTASSRTSCASPSRPWRRSVFAIRSAAGSSAT